MPAIEVAQVCFIAPILYGLEKAGVNLVRLASQSGLNKFNLTKPENYIPISIMYAFFDSLARVEGVADPQIIFAKDIQITSLADWGELVVHAPDVLSSMNLAIKYQNVVLTNEILSLDIDGPKAVFSQNFTDATVKGQAQMDVINVLVVLNGMRMALGENWDPLELHFQSEREPCLDGLLQAGSSTKVRCGQKSSAVVFPTELLAAPMLGFNNEEGASSTIFAAGSLQSKVEVILESMTQAPQLSAISMFSEINVRTLQRQLSKEGSSFSSILERWRFKKAIGLLSDQSMLIREISERLHYNDVSNFERAFKRWTKTTPGKYRKLNLS